MSGKCANVVAALRNTFVSGRTKNVTWRKTQLSALISAMESNRGKICDAMAADFNKPKFEVALTEINYVIGEAKHALDHVDKWAQRTKAEKNFLTMMNEVYIEPEPFGVALVLGAWNYPFMLSLGPMVAAIVAGNCVVVKPSELSPHSAACIEQIIRESLDEDAIKVITGDANVAKELLDCRFDKIFYTGGTRVGRIVMEAASKNLTPVTLELGGKCPVFVDSDIDYDIVGNRLVWSKFVNCGQTCLAPDYIIPTADVQQKLIASLKRAIHDFYGDNIERNKDYAHIVNDTHFKRLHALLKSCEPKMVFGGKINASTRFIEPTIVADVTANDEIMKDEIFGPILPIVVIENYDEAIRFVNRGEKPLALYMFTKRKELIDLFRRSTSSGAFAVNDCLMQATVMSLPFGGVGNSGMGSYHGKFGFDDFSHKKPCYIAPLAQENMNVVRYAPYSDEKQNVVTWIANTEASLSWLFKPLVWGYILTVFLIRLATLPRRRPNID